MAKKLLFVLVLLIAMLFASGFPELLVQVQGCAGKHPGAGLAGMNG